MNGKPSSPVLRGLGASNGAWPLDQAEIALGSTNYCFPQMSREFYLSVPVFRAVVVSIFIPFLGRERSDANRGPESESCNTTCRTEYNAAERERRKLHVARNSLAEPLFRLLRKLFHGELPQIGSPRFMGLMIPQVGDTFELFGTLRDLSCYRVDQDFEYQQMAPSPTLLWGNDIP